MKTLAALFSLLLINPAFGSVKSMGFTAAPAQTPPVIGAPNAVTLSFATAFQATDPTKPATVTVNLTSSAALTLGGGQTHTADVLVGPTSAVASGTGTIVGRYRNSSTGTVVVGIAMNTDSGVQFTFELPVGYFYAVRQTAGTVTITSAFDQSIG